MVLHTRNSGAVGFIHSEHAGGDTIQKDKMTASQIFHHFWIEYLVLCQIRYYQQEQIIDNRSDGSAVRTDAKNLHKI